MVITRASLSALVGVLLVGSMAWVFIMSLVETVYLFVEVRGKRQVC